MIEPSPRTRRLAHAIRVTQLVHAGLADTRNAVSERTGMSPSLVSRVVSELVQEGILAARSEGSTDGPGRPTERLRLRPDGGLAIGAEYGRELLTLVLSDVSGAVRHHEEIPTERYDASPAGIAWLCDRIVAFAERHQRTGSPLQGVGVAFHDVVTADGEWKRKGATGAGVEARRILERRLGVPLRIDDVSRAFADAEHRFGAGRGAADMIYLFLGREGVGSGIFVNDHLLASSTGVCGEIGHVTVLRDGPSCTCGNRGCLETVATHTALLAAAAEHVERGVPSRLSRHADFGAFTAAAAAGDEVATLVLHDLARHLQIALCSAISITGATSIVLGGDIRDSGRALPDALVSSLRRALLEPLARRVEVAYALLPAYAGAWGAAVGALDQAVACGRYVTRHLEAEVAV